MPAASPTTKTSVTTGDAKVLRPRSDHLVTSADRARAVELVRRDPGGPDDETARDDLPRGEDDLVLGDLLDGLAEPHLDTTVVERVRGVARQALVEAGEEAVETLDEHDAGLGRVELG